MLSEGEALHFVTEVLGIASPLDKVTQDPLLFLKELLSAFQVKIPFQSVSLIATEPQLRHRPTLEDIKESVLSGKGGLCYALNTFMKFLLDVLGYDIHWVIGDVLHPNNHMFTIVSNLKTPGDKYIVDIGLGIPNFEPVPIDFEDESPVYCLSVIQFKYVRKDGTLTRWHKNNSAPGADEFDWRPVCATDEQLIPREHSYFDEYMEKVYTDLDCVLSPFCKSLRAVSFHREGADPKCVALKDSTLLMERESHYFERMKMKSDEEILEKVDLYFPLLSKDARIAVKNADIDYSSALPDNQVRQ